MHLASDPLGTTPQSPPDVSLDDSYLLEIFFLFGVNFELCILFSSAAKRQKKTTFTNFCPVVETGSSRNLYLQIKTKTFPLWVKNGVTH